MAEKIRLTKNEMRTQKNRLAQLERYLPTLHLKKAMLQIEVNEVRVEILGLEKEFHRARLAISEAGGLLGEKVGFDLQLAAKVLKIQKHYENIAGVDIPIFEGVEFAPLEYSLFSTPAWLDKTIAELRGLAKQKAKLVIADEKKKALEKELREVSIRVNLFEKNLIPTAQKNIRKIKVFLGDQELAAVAQAKVAKTKIEMRKKKK